MADRALGAPDLRIHYIRVVNHLDVAFTDRWDGIPVRLEPGQTDNFQLDMAAHFFGYHYGVDQATMFRHTCKRQGWNTPKHLERQPSGKTLAEELFAGIEIKPVVYKMVEEKQDLDAPIPADLQVPPPPAQKSAPVDGHPLDVSQPINDLPPSPRRKAAS